MSDPNELLREMREDAQDDFAGSEMSEVRERWGRIDAACCGGALPSEWRDACIQQVDDLRANPNYWATTREKKIAALEAKVERLRAKLNRIYAQARQAIGAQSRQLRLTEHLANQEAADE